jgi:hypothetical protein
VQAADAAPCAALTHRVIDNPTWPQIQELIPQGLTMQDWGRMIWGGAGGVAEVGHRNAAALRQIPGLTLETATTLRNWMLHQPAGNGTAQERVGLLNQIINVLSAP